MMMTGKPSLIRFLVCANLAILVFGLLIIKNNQFASHDKQDIFDTSSTLHDDQAWYSSYKEEGKQKSRSGLLSHVVSSLWRSVSNYKEPLCEFNAGDEGLPRHMLLKKLVDCYKEMSSKNARNDNGLQSTISSYPNIRRLLRGITTTQLPEGSSDTKVFQATKGVTAISKSITQDNNIEAAFHIDYSGPKTHPPKNN